MTETLERRHFLLKLMQFPCSAVLLSVIGPLKAFAAAAEHDSKGESGHRFGMGIQIEKCIGCGRCVEACKAENDVLRKPFYFRTWVERYTVDSEGEVVVDSPNGGISGFPALAEDKKVLRSFFVPKLCNQCEKPPCVQVCPVGATFKTEDGVILVDEDYCIGCRYCIQACPYGARYMDPRTSTADKCTFCYHRITKGLLPACVEVCPTEARILGKLDEMSSPIRRLMRLTSLQVLKPYLNTEPKVLYSGLDMEVR
jgi:Fe-S-cluster-containing dehydrogenase component